MHEQKKGDCAQAIPFLYLYTDLNYNSSVLKSVRQAGLQTALPFTDVRVVF